MAYSGFCTNIGKKNLFNKDIIEIREEYGGGEPGDGEQKEKEANNVDTHVTCFLVWPRATPDSQKQLFHKDKSIKHSTSYLFLTRAAMIASNLSSSFFLKPSKLFQLPQYRT